MNINKEIFNFSDFRLFLKEFYSRKKTSSDRFTFSLFAEMTGFSSPSFLKLVMQGKKNLTPQSIQKIITGLHLKKKQADYFTELVFFNQATSLEEKGMHLDTINKFRKKNRPEKLLPEEFDYLAKWYHCVIREMVELPDFVDDPNWIAKKLLFSVDSGDVAGSLAFLEKKGFIGRNESGKLVKKDKTLATGDIGEQEMLNTIARAFHKTMVHFAAQSLSERLKTERNTSNTTLSLSEKSYDMAIKRIEQMRLELLEIAKADSHVNRVYQVNVNLFPLTKADAHGKP